jgi:predicted ABC-type ATPase
VELRPFFKQLFLVLSFVSAVPLFSHAEDWSGDAIATEQQYKATQWKADESDRYVGDFVEERKLENLRYPTAYVPARQKVQDEIIQDVVRSGKISAKPRIIFTAGAYGAGKSTVLDALERTGYYDGKTFLRIDPDAIKEKIPEYAHLKAVNPSMAPTLVHRESTYIADLAFERALAQGKDVILDSSLKDTDHYRALIERIRKIYPHYQIEIVAVEASRNRVLQAYEERAQKTGRVIPADQIDESIEKSMASVDALTNDVDRVLKISNENTVPMLKEIRVNGKRIRRNIQLFGNSHSRNTLAHAIPKRMRVSTIANPFKVATFDLDWTMVSSLFEKPDQPDWKVVYVDGQYYRASDRVDEVLKRIHENPSMKIAFWSKGSRSRNLQLLQQLKPPTWNGKSLYDVGELIFSKEDLVNGQKILSKVSKNHSNVVLIDDQLENIVGSKGKGIFLGKTYNVYETEKDVMAALKAKTDDPRYIPENLLEWRRDRNRMAGVYEILERANAESKKTGEAFSTLVERFAAEPRGPYVEAGLRRLNGRGGSDSCLGQVLKNAF